MKNKFKKYSYLIMSVLLFAINVSCENPIEPLPEIDSTPCSDVTELNSQSGNGTILLTWINPGDDDYDQAQIVFIPEVNSVNQPLVVEGTKASILITGLMNNTEYEIIIKTMDKSGNVSPGVSIKDTPDGDSPTVQLSTEIGDYTNLSNFDVTITFSEIVSGFTSEDIINENCILSDLHSVDEHTFVVTVEPQNEGSVSLSILMGSVLDGSGNENLSSNLLTINYDVSALLATITPLNANEKTSPVEFNIAFNKIVFGFEQSDLIIENGICFSFNSSDNKNFIAQVTPHEEGNVVLSIPVNSITDNAGNPNSELSLCSINYDISNPKIEITSTISGTVCTSPIPVSIKSSELIDSISTDDFVVENGSITNIQTVDNIIFTADIVPSGINVSVFLAENMVGDIAGNLNDKSNVFQFVFDSSNPTVIVDPVGDSPSNGSQFEFNITFSEPVLGFTVDDIVVVNGSVRSLEFFQDLYILIIIPVNEGDISISVPENICQDQGGNGNFVSNTVTSVYDIAPPPLPQISGDNLTENLTPQWSWTGAADVIEYSYRLNSGEWLNTDSSNTIYRVQNPLSIGDHVFEVKAKDYAGNWSSAASFITTVYIADRINPAVVVSSVGESQSNFSQFEFDITFSELVYGFSANDISVINGSIKSFEFIQDHYSLIINPINEGNISISVPENICQDQGGNGNLASNTLTSVYDITPPSLPQISGDSLTENLTPQWSWTGIPDVKEYSYRLDLGEWINTDNSNTIYTVQKSLHTGAHVFEVKAKDYAGNWSSAASFTTTVYIEKPEIYRIYNRGTIGTEIHWKNLSTSATSYTVERKIGSNGIYTEIENNNYIYNEYNSFDDDGPLIENTTYYYRMKVYNNMGESEYTEISTTVPSKPIAPSNLQVELLNDGNVSLSWQDNSSDEDGFTIYFDDNDVQGVSADKTSCIIAYYYHYNSDRIVDIKVVSYKDYGYSGNYEDESEPSIAHDFAIPKIPESPTIRIEETDEDKPELKFRDRDNNENGFEIERRGLGEEYTVIKTLPASAGKDKYVIYIDDSAPGGKILEYRVRSYREVEGVPFKLYCRNSFNTEEVSLPYLFDSFPEVHQNSFVREEQTVFYRFPVKYNGKYNIVVKGKNEDSSYTADVKYRIIYHKNNKNSDISFHNNTINSFNNKTGKTIYQHTVYNHNYMYIFIEGVDKTSIGTFSVEVSGYPVMGITHKDGNLQYNKIDSGSISIGSSKTEEFTIKNYGEGVLEINSIDLEQTGTDFSIDVFSDIYSGVSLRPGESRQFLLQLEPQSVGPKTVNVVFNTNIYNNEAKSFTVNMYGDGNKPVLNVYRQNGDDQAYTGDNLAYNKYYSLDPLPIGNSVSETYIIKNTGNTILKLTGSKLVNASGVVSVDTFATNSVLMPGESTTFVLTFTPSQPSINYGVVTIESNDPDFTPFSIRFEGFGQAPVININQKNTTFTSGEQYQFDDQLINGSQRLVEFTILNKGNDTLNINSITLEDTTNFSIIQPVTNTVPINGTTTFSIVSVPTSAGYINSVVTINTNDYNQNDFSIPIRSKGIIHTKINTFGVFLGGELISQYSGKYYSLDVIAGNTYTVVWSDTDNNSNFTGDIKVSCKDSNFINKYFTKRNDGSINPPKFTAKETETLVLDVTTRTSYSSNTGTFAIGVILD